jgi:zinc transporter ZupT
MKRNILLLLLVLFSLMNPIGAALGAWLQEGQTGGSLHQVFDILTALATGSFLHISTTILYENNDHHKLSPIHLVAAASGGLLAIL